MYNLNVSLAQSAVNAVNNLLVESTCTTPRTPEIVNSLIAMTNPLDYTFGENAQKQTNGGGAPTNISTDSNSSSSSQMESPTNSTPSILHTRSQLVKAGLKLSIEQKRKHQNDGEDLFDLDKCKRIKKHESESEEDRQRQDGGIHQYWTLGDNDIYDCSKLTPEDEERRRRRRERNKIAATKCRLKKRERTANLITESETLETQNIDLKKQLQDLRTEHRSLLDMLSVHRPHCQHNITPATREKLYRIPSIGMVMDQNSYSRPSSVDNNTNYRTQNNVNLDCYTRPNSVGISGSLTYTRPTSQHYSKPPSIIVEEVDDTYQTHLLANLDDGQLSSVYFNTQCHNYNGSQNYANPSGLDNGCMA